MPGRPLEGRIALVTGGSRGIGAGIARKLASWGCKVCVTDVDRSAPAEALKEALSAAGVDVSLHQADVAKPDEIQSLMAEIAALHGGLDILVQNAGPARLSLLEDATLADWQFVQDANARATWLLAKAALPLMTGRRGARYITITNATTRRIVPFGGLSAAAMAGLEALTAYLAYELAPHGIVVNCVRPGLTDADDMKMRPDLEEALAHESSVSPWNKGERVTTVEDCADVVAMLCQDEADWIVGQTIDVDGGNALWHGLQPGKHVDG